MKLINLLTVILLLATVILNAQISVDDLDANPNGAVLKIEGAIDTLGGSYPNVTSDLYESEDFNGSSLYFSYLFTSAAGSPNATCIIKGSDYNTAAASMVNIDTVFAAVTGETEVHGTISLDNAGALPKYFRIYLQSNATGQDSDFKFRLKATKRDF
jgi:hypothetical protein